jgi:hypothetical protein
MKKVVMAVTAAGLFGLASVAQAGEPMQLSDTQMDAVSAGATAGAIAAGLALGNLDTSTVSLTTAVADSIAQTAAATASNTSLALSVSGGPILGGAVAASGSATVASLP